MKAQINTSAGEIPLELDGKNAPKTVDNFVSYVKSGFYDETIFHRVIKGFMIQGGGFDKDMNAKRTSSTIENEANNGLTNDVGTVAMARTMDPHSASSQFFINLVDNSRLDHRSKDSRGYGYAVFGKVIEGMDVVDKIAQQKTLCPSSKRGPCNAKLPMGMRDVPAEPIVIKKAYQRKVK